MPKQKNKTYAGVGSRRTPADILLQMTKIASFMESQGYILHSGRADGADKAFEDGVSDRAMKKIFLPWRLFNRSYSNLYLITEEAMRLAEKFHPFWEALSHPGKQLMARNGYQVLGESLNDPVDMLICYTTDGKASGGTGQAIRIAQHYKIPIFNMFFKKDIEILLSWIAAGEVFFKREVEIVTWNLI